MQRINAGIMQVEWLLLHLDHLLGVGERDFEDFHQISVCIFLSIFQTSIETSITICNHICVKEYSADCDSEQNQNSISKLKAELGVYYATNSNHHVPLLNSFSFPVHICVFNYATYRPAFTICSNLSQMRFLLCSSFQQLSQNGMLAPCGLC